jgi:hypothetical protein
MRYLLALALVFAAACGTDPIDDGMGSGSGRGSGSGTLDPPARGFQIVSPEITIMPGQEITYCWYFKTPNTELMTVKRWESLMTDGSHHMIMFFTNDLVQPEGTVSASNCGAMSGGISNIPSWIYASQNIHSDMKLPADDGNGVPLGMDVPPGKPAYLQMHYLNSSDDPLVVRVKINGEAHEAGVTTTKTAAYITYNDNIDIPPMSMGVKATNTCDIPATSKVWMMSTHAHKQAVKTEVRNGMPASTDVVFTSDDWEHPGAKAWMTTPFYQFSSGRLTYECTYDNPGPNRIQSGDSAQTDEMCMATGYTFPATRATICFNNFIVPF